ncbi:metal-dependent hydrolase [Paenibacillus endoradicis]|uniref:metal-dependent hydrolase n=1 Tax=Paenibacillus endoradicis TaxID=2972487 RepID=UPI002159776A|nr:metal-dependent hydrolase [Paenibacillus endoradicis]MCR8659495.1 metal-dependent hydrolase [Paenibacillus endoradicis]
MDTASHFVVGVGLAGLSQLDPVVISQPAMQTAVILATIIGSQAPDFDTITRLRSNEIYIRQHRGISHSIPAVLLWTILISASFYMFFDLNEGYGHLLSWTLLAVGLHVGMDLFNTYGTQALRPFSRVWISWNIIHIFDPFIFITHVIAGILWISRLLDPSLIFPVLYIVIAIYYVVRVGYHYYLKRYLNEHIPIHKNEILTIIPTVRFRIWHLMIKMRDGSYKLGTLNRGNIRWVEQISSDHHPLIDKSRQHPTVAALLSFTKHTVAHITEHPWGTEVRWCDARYRHRRQYPFVAIVFYDHDEQPLASYVGWLNDQKLYKRLYNEAKLSSQ